MICLSGCFSNVKFLSGAHALLPSLQGTCCRNCHPLALKIQVESAELFSSLQLSYIQITPKILIGI